MNELEDKIFLGLLFFINFLVNLGFVALAIFYTLRSYTVRTDLIVMTCMGIMILSSNGLLLGSKFKEMSY